MAGVTFETRQDRTSVHLPDIFRTAGGVDFGIGPTDRLRDARHKTDKENLPGGKKGRGDKDGNIVGNLNSFPRIVLKDTLGRELDTFTTLQEAIYRAKWNIKQTGQSKVPLEWRLPKAPPPARPDLTRPFPPVKPLPHINDYNKQTFRNVSGNIMEFDVEDVGFVKESLQYLPYAPSLSFLRQEILVGPKTYFQIVGTMLLHQKILSQTEKRRAIYNFPGFCSGCLRMGLCYGCERSTQIHYHEDKPVKTGGGFTYFKKDRPENEIRSHNPTNWKVHDPSKTLKKLMEEYAGVDLEGEIPDEVKKHLDQYGGQRVRKVAQIPDYAKGFEEFEKQQDEKRKAEANDHLLSQSGEQIGVEGDDIEADLDLIARYNSQEQEEMRGQGQGEAEAGDIDLEMEGESGFADYEFEKKGSRDQPQVDVPTAGYPHVIKPEFGDQHTMHVTFDGRKSPSYEGFEHRLPKYRRKELGDEEEEEGEEEEGDMTGGRDVDRTGRRRERLYRPPPPFKPRKSPSRKIVAKSPFSTDRKYDLPTGKGFQVRKSEKAPTEFVEFKSSDVAWKEPKKFELKKSETKTTKFWSGPPPSKKKEKKRERKTRSLSPPRKKTVALSPRSHSPDSGVESGFKTDNKDDTNEELVTRKNETVSSSRDSELTTTIYRKSRTLEDFKNKLQAVLSNKNDADKGSSGSSPLKVPTGRKESFQAWEWFAVNYETSDESDDDDDDNKSKKMGDDRISRTDGYRRNKSWSNRPAYLKYSPPLLPPEMEFDQMSLTSFEPELDLDFSDAIDVEKIEIVDEINIDEDKKTKEEKKHRRHRRKHKRKTKSDRHKENREETFTKGDSNMTENDLTGKTLVEKASEATKETVGELTNHEEEVFDEAVSLIKVGLRSIEHSAENVSNPGTLHEPEENSQLPFVKKTTRRYGVRSQSSDSLNSEDKKLIELEDSDSDNNKNQFGYDFDRYSRTSRSRGKIRKQTADQRDVKLSSKEMRHKRNIKDTKRQLNTKKTKQYEWNLKRVFSHDCTTHEVEKGKKVKQFSEVKKPDESEEEAIYFKALPSIQQQLAKILTPSQKVVDDGFGLEETGDDTVSDVETEDKTSDIQESFSYRYHRNFNHRPKSAKPLHIDRVPRPRSMSLPLVGDFEEMLKGFDITKLREPIKVPVYLPSFPRGRIIKKKEKCANPRRVKGRESRSMSVPVVSELLPMVIEDSTTKSELETLSEETPPRPPTPVKPLIMEETPTPVQPPTPEKPARREIVKKEKKPVERKPKEKPRTPTPPPPKPPTPVEEKPPSRETSFVFVREREQSLPQLPELPPIEIPELPEIKTPESKQREDKPKPKKMLIEVTPDLKEAPKKLRGPPKLAPRIKPFVHIRRSKVAEAPITTEELEDVTDPLDFLAKYCIINPERLPYYERVFNSALSVQTPRYSRDLEMSPGAMIRLPPAHLSSHELHMLRDLTVLSRVESVRKQGLTAPEQYLEKLNYSIEFIQRKQETIADKMAQLQGEKTHYMAELAKLWKPEIGRVSYRTKTKSKRKKRKARVPDYDTFGAMAGPPKDFEPRSLDDITDEVVVSRMDEKMLKKAKKDPTVRYLNLQIKRDIERLKEFDKRLMEIDDEKDRVNLYCMDHYFSEQMAATRPVPFRRQQSELYQRLNPEPDTDMNIEEVEAALQQINNRLITEKEFQYIYFILNLPRREKINFRLFCIIAALSEKVSQMDPFVRKLVNKVDYNALDVKMEKSKELFGLLKDGDALPGASALASDLSVELTAGGLTPEHTKYVLSKFNREDKGFVDFLDFVTYVPLFIEIHKRIIDDPFNDSLQI